MLPPNAAPDAAPTKSVDININWVSIIIGLLLPLTNESQWDGTPAERENASEQADELITQLMQ